jgi:Na+/proline symporter
MFYFPVCFIFLTCLYLAIVVYAPALALAQVTGMNTDLSIGLTFLVCIFYTAIGGIKAVIWTNVFQVKSNNLSNFDGIH